MARIAIGGFGHETNSFSAHRADYAYFNERRDRPPLVRGEELIEALRGSSFPLAGFVAAMEGAHELVPLAWAHGAAGGTVTSDAFERIAGELMGALSQAGPIDGLYLDLHGAMAAQDFDDADGELLRRMRAALGDTPIVVSLDYHANISPQAAARVDAMVVFRTYPHIDRPETGARAGQALEAVMRRGRPAGCAVRKAPFLIPASAQCTLEDPSRLITARSRLLDGDVIALSYAAGFPHSDVPFCGPAVVAHAWSQAAADTAVDEMFALLCAQEGAFAAPLLPAEQAVARAVKATASAPRPVVIADVQDNPGGGGTGDTTGLLTALLNGAAERAVLGILCDPHAAAAAHAAGEGADVTLALGGRHGPPGVAPISARFVVRRLGDGRFRTTGVMAGGSAADLGPMALLGIGGVDVVVSSRRMQAFDRAPFEHLGVDLPSCKIIAVKSTVHFRAEFEPIAHEVILAAAPGYFVDRPEELPYRRLREGVRLSPNGAPFKRG